MPVTITPVAEQSRPPLIDKRALLLLYQQKRFDKICEWIVQICIHFDKVFYTDLSGEDRLRVDNIVGMLSFFFSQEDFHIPDQFAPIIVNVAHLLANIFFLSSYGTTDCLLRHIGRQPSNFVRLMALYTVLNKAVVPPEAFFEKCPSLASIWWLNYQTAAAGTTTEELHQRVTGQFLHIPENYTMRDFRVAPLYFNCSYYTYNGEDRKLKELLNKEVRKFSLKHTVTNNPDPKSIAIVTGKWQPNTAVFKSMAPYLDAVSDHFDLTLIHYGKNAEHMDFSKFKHVKSIKARPDRTACDLSEIEKNDFSLVYFMDVGMCEESVYLANLRLAPIMATGYGHPVSTFGSLIDYFFGGVECEDASLANENYSERLVLLPGLGAHPVYPNYARQYPKKDTFVINCAWTTSKINWPMLQMLKRAMDRAKRPTIVQFFPSWTVNRYNCVRQFVTNLSQIFGNRFRVFYDKPYHEYLTELEKGSLAVDSFPFGGYNTVIDSMFVGIPVISIEGTRFYNRASSALLRRVGLDYLITHSEQECENKLVSLIDNPDELRARASVLDSDERLQELLIHTPEPAAFVKAFEYLIANHETLKGGTKPIYIQ